MQFIDLKSQQNYLLHSGKTLREDINERIKTVLDHGQFILGPETSELESELKEYVGVKHCIAVSSGTDALLLALMALEITTGDEVITTPFSFISTIETIQLLGAKPVFVDINPTTYNIDHNSIEKNITSKTKAIIPVSLYGQTANFTEINKLAKNYQIPVIEDGAQSFGSTHYGAKSCGLSTIGTTSFFPSKPLGCYGDGGACFTNNDEIAEKIRRISTHGQIRRYEHVEVGINGRIDTIQAAVLLAKLKIFHIEVQNRETIGSAYTNKLNDMNFHNTPYIEANNTSVYAQYTVKVSNREKVQQLLKCEGIPTSIHYPKPLNRQKSYLKYLKSNNISLEMNNAYQASKSVLSLPMHPWLSSTDQDLIISKLLKSID